MDTPITYWFETLPFPILTTLTLVPLASMAAILLSRTLTTALRFGFAGTLITALLSLYLLTIFNTGNPNIQLVEKAHFAWLSYCVGIDGANILFIPLTATLTFTVRTRTASLVLILRPFSLRNLGFRD